jgi:GTPase SAR1 family protein
VKQVPIPDTNIVVELFIYDCAGQSIFNQLEMTSKYYENASAVMTVYSIASRDSLLATAKWIAAVKAVQNSGVALIGAFVGNKAEFRDGSIDSRAEVGTQEGRESAEVQGMAYFETSAANNICVEEPFQHIAQEFYKRYNHSIYTSNSSYSVFVIYMRDSLQSKHLTRTHTPSGPPYPPSPLAGTRTLYRAADLEICRAVR